MLRQLFLYLSNSKRLRRGLLKLPRAQRLAAQFVAGETLPQALEAVRALNTQGMMATLDHLGENVLTEQDARAARQAYVEILRAIVRERLQSTISLASSIFDLEIKISNIRQSYSAGLLRHYT